MRGVVGGFLSLSSSQLRERSTGGRWCKSEFVGLKTPDSSVKLPHNPVGGGGGAERGESKPTFFPREP